MTGRDPELKKAAEENAARVLRESGLKATAARAQILSAMGNEDKPLAAADIYRRLAGAIGIATVYRSLAAFARAGIAQRLPADGGEARFELHPGAAHSQLVCTKCGKIEEVADPGIERLKARVFRKSGFADGNHSLYFYADCRRQECDS